MDNPQHQQADSVQPLSTPAASFKQTRKQVWWALIAGLPLCGLLGWFAALNSPYMADYQRLLAERAGVQAELEGIRNHNQQLQVDLLVARESLADGQAAIEELEQQLFRLQQDLAQYKGALTPKAMAPGIRIQAFELQHTDEPGVFRYKVMVSRVGNESDTVEADLHIQVQGKLNGKAAKLSLAELTGGRDESLALEFRYFQVVPANGNTAELTLPTGFVPEQVHLTAERNGKQLLEQTMEWTETAVKP